MDDEDLDTLLDIAVACVGSVCPEDTKTEASRLIAMVVIEKRRRIWLNAEVNEPENELY
jgi:hypothetical protein